MIEAHKNFSGVDYDFHLLVLCWFFSYASAEAIKCRESEEKSYSESRMEIEVKNFLCNMHKIHISELQQARKLEVVCYITINSDS